MRNAERMNPFPTGWDATCDCYLFTNLMNAEEPDEAAGAVCAALRKETKMKMMKTTHTEKRPCNSCRQPICHGQNCPRWQSWFLEAWEGIHRSLWLEMDAQGRMEQRKFYYDQPHMIKGPCDTCGCRDWCDVPCSLRRKWWDGQMEILRRRGSCHAQR